MTWDVATLAMLSPAPGAESAVAVLASMRQRLGGHSHVRGPREPGLPVKHYADIYAHRASHARERGLSSHEVLAALARDLAAASGLLRLVLVDLDEWHCALWVDERDRVVAGLASRDGRARQT